MKTTLLLTVSAFLLGFGIILLGALFRTQQWAGGSVLLFVGLLLQTGAMAFLFIGLVRRYRPRL
ncbi:hypothetical protein ACFPAF_12800 [Hymenobacter endophyticus]|uniref:Gliding motility protein GldL-like N-terminal domain-containing protein n=1 Tax=Hymenobacter endophyticus TaxID=3076335 RepID=A0ABU3TIS0_9BACT|nr:hypothetical protein [Hymenobacter endophyticus]MDU0371279.1 hypothetical protein [Hymenobacter endophyticus]